MALRQLFSFKYGFLTKIFFPATLHNVRQQHSIDNEILDSCKKDQPIELDHNPFEKEKEQCLLCKMDITPNYKNVRLLSQFCSSYTGRVYGRHITRLCLHKQEQVEKEILKAQTAGFMGYITKERTFLEDPQIFDPEKPLRPHKY